MSILPRVEVSVRVANLTIDLQLGAGKARDDGAGPAGVPDPIPDAAPLDQLLGAASPVERLLDGPDALARFRTSVPADPSPIAARGMTVRVGDILGEIATRADVGVSRTIDATLRAASLARTSEAVNADRALAGGNRVPPVVDSVGIPQRILGIGGTVAAESGANAALTVQIGGANAAGNAAAVSIGQSNTVLLAGGLPASGSGNTDAPFLAGLVNIIDRLGSPVAAPRDAPAGAVLLYGRADGTTALELRTATGFASATAASAVSLTGDPANRSGNGLMLFGVFVVPARTGAALANPALNEAADPGQNDRAATFTASAAVDRAAAGTPPATADGALGSRAAHPPQADGFVHTPPAPAYGTAMATSTLGGIAAHQLGLHPDGSTMPAGLVVAQADARASVSPDTSDHAGERQFVYSIWYDVLALRFAAAGVSLLDRSTVLRDVVWATAIEHGPFAAPDGADILSRIAAAIDLPTADDAAIIAAIFAERARIGADGDLTHFPEVLSFDRDRVIARLADEAVIAATRVAAR